MQGIVDGFEGDFCIIEIDGKTKDIPRKQVDKGTKTGDVVELKNGIWVTNQRETEDRIREIKSLMNELWED